jgi:hypothetical protein
MGIKPRMKKCKLGSGVQLQALLKQESIKQTRIKKNGQGVL